MKTHRFTAEHSLYFLAFLLGLTFRLFRLGSASLSDFEAGWALQALGVANGEPVALGPAPGYTLLTGLAFFLFGSSNAVARLWPALAGSLLPWLPFFFRPYLARQTGGRAAGIILAFGLALDPGLVALSRLAGGPMLAVGFGLLALAFVFLKRPILAGLCGGLALLGGPAALHGALGLGIAWGIGGLLVRFGILEPLNNEQPAGLSTSRTRAGVIATAGTLLLAGTLFFRYPQGLGSLAGILPAYLAGWTGFAGLPDGIPATRLLGALVFYEPLVLVFALVAALRGWVSGISLPRWLSLWALAALALALSYPGRMVGDLAWALAPLWALAAMELALHLKVFDWERLPALGQAALIILLMSLAWINLAGLGQSGPDPQVYRLRWAVIGGTLLLGAVTTVLVGLGWSPVIAQRGLVWGLAVAFGLYQFSGLWGSTQLRPDSAQELWYPPPVTQQAEHLMKSLEDLSEWRTGQRTALDVLVASDAPSLRWALRDWPGVVYRPEPLAGESPSVVIRPGEQTPPSLASAYRGQDFSWWEYPGWGGGLPQDWPHWLVFRQAPIRTERLILWARGDLFPGGSTLLPGEAPNGEQDLPGDENPVPGEQPAE